MSLLREIMAAEVYPALGCTEPICCAYAAAIAAAHLGCPVESVVLRVDPATFKNGAAVIVPHSGGAKGNLIAAALGAVLARPEAKLELLREVSPEILGQARRLYDSGRCRSEALPAEGDLRVEVDVAGGGHTARCVLAGGHTNIESIQRDGRTLFDAERHASAPGGLDRPSLAYRQQLKQSNLQSLLALGDELDDDDRESLRRGLAMNLSMAECGFDVGRTASHLRQMHEDGYLADDMFYRTKLRVASAVDARMAGVAKPVMTSGGSGNQGIVATLTVHGAAEAMGVDEDALLRSLAVAHVINAYTKCFVGELSVICGCAMGAGIASAAAIVYQQAGSDMRKITLAVNSVIGDLGGLICDGAKPGCAMKAVTAVDAALRSGLMALNGYGLSVDDGLVGQTAEESIRNLGRITLEGMFSVDPTLLAILQEKATSPGRA